MRSYRLALLLNVVSCICGDDESLVVSIDQGLVRGYELVSRNGTKYRGFLGIPFAKPPIGDLRFEPPQEPIRWNGIRNASIVPPRCVQKDVLTKMASVARVVGQEDCLYLNVFAPLKVRKQSKLPVLVYIHGGGFTSGTGSAYLPVYFLDYDVIVVFLNYRLGPFGFLSTADKVMPGNVGMKDQTAALKWVKKNIDVFGGDTQRITIFGESAGGASVHFHMYSPLSKGLFHRAISQSGTATTFWAKSDPVVIREKTIAFGILAGCPVESSTTLIRCLRKIPADELMEIHQKFYVWDFEPIVPFSIVVESEEVENAFLPIDVEKRGPVNSVPWMTGITSGEGILRAARFLSDDGQRAKQLNDAYKRLLPLAGQFTFSLKYEHTLRIAEATKQFYFGDKNIGFETASKLVDMLTDVMFAYPCVRAASQYTDTVYLYYYDHRNSFTWADLYGNLTIDLGVCHVDDLTSLFYDTFWDIKVSDGADLKVSERMVKYWINFARTGNPNNEENLWQPTGPSESKFLHVGTERDIMKHGLLSDRMAFWRDVLSTRSSPHAHLDGEKARNEF